eukprot:gb/GECG01009848.1/.p1 GENE.gb/GECG01009848.1/~~gb/GECG01009848.1/.p1  ORF type:complete len:594 (+),score=69.05 gb/GECG01009848.1/:1-1782(+)
MNRATSGTSSTSGSQAAHASSSSYTESSSWNQRGCSSQTRSEIMAHPMHQERSADKVKHKMASISIPFDSNREASDCLQRLSLIARSLGHGGDVTTLLRELAKGSVRAIPHADLMMKLNAASSLMQSGTGDTSIPETRASNKGDSGYLADDTDDLSFDDLKQIVLFREHENAVLKERLATNPVIDAEKYLTIYFGRTHPPYLVTFGDEYGISATYEDLRKELSRIRGGSTSFDLHAINADGTTVSLDHNQGSWMNFMANARKRIIVSDADYTAILDHGPYDTADETCDCWKLTESLRGVRTVPGQGWEAHIKSPDDLSRISLGIHNSEQVAGHVYDTALFAFQQYERKNRTDVGRLGAARFNYKPVFLPTEAVSGDFFTVCQKMKKLKELKPVQHDDNMQNETEPDPAARKATLPNPFEATTAHSSTSTRSSTSHACTPTECAHSDGGEEQTSGTASVPTLHSTSSASSATTNSTADTCQEPTSSTRRLIKTSEFRGVKFCKRSKKYVASIQVDGTARRLGTFDDEVAAALAYDKAARELNDQYPDRHPRRKFRPNFDENGERLPYVKPRHQYKRGPVVVQDISSLKMKRESR